MNDLSESVALDAWYSETVETLAVGIQFCDGCPTSEIFIRGVANGFNVARGTGIRLGKGSGLDVVLVTESFFETGGIKS